MSKFEERYVISEKNKEVAIVGKGYFYGDSYVNKQEYSGTLTKVENTEYCFRIYDNYLWKLLYPTDETLAYMKANNMLDEDGNYILSSKKTTLDSLENSTNGETSTETQCSKIDGEEKVVSRAFKAGDKVKLKINLGVNNTFLIEPIGTIEKVHDDMFDIVLDFLAEDGESGITCRLKEEELELIEPNSREKLDSSKVTKPKFRRRRYNFDYEDTVMLCDTEDKASIFLNHMLKEGVIKDKESVSILLEAWFKYKEKTCYTFAYDRVKLGDLLWYTKSWKDYTDSYPELKEAKRDFTILSFDDFDWIDSSKAKTISGDHFDQVIFDDVSIGKEEEHYKNYHWNLDPRLQEIAEFYGKDFRRCKLIEEMGELLKALMETFTSEDKSQKAFEELNKNLFEELADVLSTVQSFILSLKEEQKEEVMKQYEYKLKRTLENMRKEK